MKRIPHQSDAIETVAHVAAYAKQHENMTEMQFKPFLKAIDRLPVKGRLLEIGSGPGFLTALVAERCPDSSIMAVEPSLAMIESARRYVDGKGLGNRIEFVQGKVDDPRFMAKLGQFDLVFSAFSLHHWENPPVAWRCLMSRLNRNGTLFIFDLKRVSWLYYLPLINGFFNSVRAAYRPREIVHMLKNMGLRKFAIQTLFPYFWMTIQIPYYQA